MNNQDETKQPVHEQVNDPTSQSHQNPTKLVFMFALLALVGFSAAAFLAGYLIAKGMIPVPFVQFTDDTNGIPPIASGKACPEDAKICPDGSSVGRIPPDCEFAPCPSVPLLDVTPVPKPTLKPNPSGNTFRSDTLGISFYYAYKMLGGTASLKVVENENRVYVYPSGVDPLSGQYVEMWKKDPTLTLGEAITRQFLGGISPQDCYVELEKTVDPNIVKATIAYPVPAGSNEPSWMYGELCPDGYKRSNGMAYFYYDTRIPDKYYYFSIGQYGIPAYTGNDQTMWQDTVVVN